MRTKKAGGILISLAAAVVMLCLAQEPSAASITTVIVMDNTPLPCRILSHDEKTITIYLIELKATSKVEWDKLAPMERRRLKNLLQIDDVENTGRPLGEKIDGVMVTMANGMSYRGIELTDRASPSHRYFRFPRVPFMAISVKDIKKVDPIKIYEGDVYTPDERYRTKLAISPARTAEDHFRMGEWCLENELPTEAGDHFAKAQLLDGSYEERCAARKAELAALAARLQARELYAQILRDKAAGRYSSAIRNIDVLANQYPDFEENTKLAMEKPILEKEHATMLRHEVVGMYYQFTDHFVQKCAQEKKSETPPTPLTTVRLNTGFEISGKLKGSAEGEGDVTLDCDGVPYKIKREDIASVDTRMVETGPYRWRTLAECQKYVTDRRGGITADVVAAIGKQLEIDDKQVQEIWGQRLGDAYEVDASGIRRPTFVTTYQEAAWSIGSWLRGAGSGGSGGMPDSSELLMPPGPGGRPRRNPRNPGGGGAQQGGGQQQQQQWDDPETWWLKQSPQVKGTVLKAMCMEATMKVEKAYEESCTNCGGTGTIEVMSVGVGSTGGRFTYPCHICRGSGTFWRISYR